MTATTSNETKLNKLLV